MGGADDDWLREIVHALRQPKSDRKKLAKDALTEHETKLNSPNNAPYISGKLNNVLAEEFPRRASTRWKNTSLNLTPG